jgi:hypothetical protein
MLEGTIPHSRRNTKSKSTNLTMTVLTWRRSIRKLCAWRVSSWRNSWTGRKSLSGPFVNRAATKLKKQKYFPEGLLDGAQIALKNFG